MGTIRENVAKGRGNVKQVEDKVKMVHVRWIPAHARVNPHGVNPEHPSPLSAPRCAFLLRLSASGTSRVPAPSGRSLALRRKRQNAQWYRYLSASFNLLTNDRGRRQMLRAATFQREDSTRRHPEVKRDGDRRRPRCGRRQCRVTRSRVWGKLLSRTDVTGTAAALGSGAG
jgi:hypothetical protein